MIVLSDLDHTLVDENSTYGFVRMALEEAGRSDDAEAVARLHGRTGGRGFLFAALHRVTGSDLARPWALGRLAGLERDFLVQVGRRYAPALWDRAPLAAPRDRLEELRRDGGRVVLVSSSLEEVVAPIAELLGVDHRASALAYQGGRCTGTLERDLTGRKEDAVEELLRSGEPLAFLTDNLTDYDLMARADRRIVVLRRASERAAWARLEPEFVEVGG